MIGSALSLGAQNRSVDALEKEASRLDRSARAETWLSLAETYRASESFAAATVMEKAAIAYRNAFTLTRGRKKKAVVREAYEGYLAALDARAEAAVAARDWAAAASVSRFLVHNRSLYPFRRTDTLSLARLGKASLRLGSLSEARQALEKTLGYGYTGVQGDVIADLGKTYIAQGEIDMGARLMAEGLEMFPGSAPLKECLVAYHFADARRKAASGAPAEAAAAYRRTLEADPAHKGAWAGLAAVLDRQAREARAAAVKETDGGRFSQLGEAHRQASEGICEAVERLMRLMLARPAVRP